MSTVQDVIDLAVDLSALNDPNLINNPQMVRQCAIYEQRAYLAAAKENPDFFGKSATLTRASFANPWDASSFAAITYAEVAAITGTPGPVVGDVVNIVSIRHPGVEFSPRVIVQNRNLYEYNQELSDGSEVNKVDDLLVYGANLPAAVTALGSTITLPDEHMQLLALPLAQHLAIRDMRMDDATMLQQLYQQAWENFLQQVRTYDTPVVFRPLSSRAGFTGPVDVDLDQGIGRR